MTEIFASSSVPPFALGVKSAAKSIGISVRKLNQLIQVNEIESFRVGNRRLLSMKAIERYIRNRENAALLGAGT